MRVRRILYFGLLLILVPLSGEQKKQNSPPQIVPKESPGIAALHASLHRYFGTEEFNSSIQLALKAHGVTPAKAKEYADDLNASRFDVWKVEDGPFLLRIYVQTRDPNLHGCLWISKLNGNFVFKVEVGSKEPEPAPADPYPSST